MKRFLSFYTRFFGLWVLVGFATAYFFPNLFIPLKGGMDLFFAFTMFGIGIVLNIDELKLILKKPLLIIFGVTLQYTLMPSFAFIFSRIFQLSSKLSLGLILTGSAPGAMSSNVISYLAGADVAYSVSLTTASTFLSPLLTPLLTLFLAKEHFSVDFWVMFSGIIKMVVIPLSLGIFLKLRFKDKFKTFVEVFPALSVTFIVFICSLVAALNKTYIAQMSFYVLLVVLVLNLAGYISGYGLAKIFKLNKKRCKTLSVEIGMQNAGLGTVLALKYFSYEVALPAALFVITSVLTSALLARYWRNSSIDVTPMR